MAKFTYTGPENLRPLSPWAYFGYSILFNIPLIGFICLIIFSINNDNINRRNFARSYWCVYVIIAILIVISVVTGIGAGIADEVVSSI